MCYANSMRFRLIIQNRTDLHNIINILRIIRVQNDQNTYERINKTLFQRNLTPYRAEQRVLD